MSSVEVIALFIVQHLDFVCGYFSPWTGHLQFSLIYIIVQNFFHKKQFIYAKIIVFDLVKAYKENSVQ
jgi:hypothetical protein